MCIDLRPMGATAGDRSKQGGAAMSWLLDPLTLPTWLVIVIQWHGIALGAWCMWVNMKLREIG
jgi:hypothetical protein